MLETTYQAVQFFEHKQCWLLTTAHTAYLMRVAADGRLQHLYWGERLPYPADYPGLGRATANFPGANFSEEAFELRTYGIMAVEEYPAWGGLLYTEPCLKASFADGVRDLVLEYQSYLVQAEPNTLPKLVITLKDSFYPLEVDLHYKIVPECDLIERWAVIRNTGQAAIAIEAALSACWHLPVLVEGNYRLSHLSGRWNADTQIRRTQLTDGRTTLESRRGMTSAEANPFFFVDVWHAENGGANEAHGEVWFGGLGWSGNWKIVLEQSSNPHRLYVAGGLNDFDFRWHLAAGTAFTTPSFTAGYTSAGFGQASRNLHRYQLDYLLPRQHAAKLRPVLYNSWEAVFFDVTEEKQLNLAERAVRLGVELFVVDDGWFGQRHHDRAGLGDWYVNPQKFPNGLGRLVERVNELGMDFGIWVEPEMVNPDSDLYRAHPDWVYHFPNRPRTEFRHQLMLNLARPEVVAYLYAQLDKLLTAHNIRFIKWDFNRPVSEPGWPDAPLEQQREVNVRHIAALYNLVDSLRTKHPRVVWEACASGGGRVDLGVLSHFDQTWPSDNTDPFDRLFIQEGYSLAYAPKTMLSWATHSPTSQHINNSALSLRYRFHSAMSGALGLGEDLNKYSEEEMAEVADLVAEYKQIRPLVQEGLLYRLISPRNGYLAAVQYNNRDRSEAVVFIFQHTQHYWQAAPTIKLQGLNPTSRYRLEGLAGETEPISGQSLMSLGIRLKLSGHFASQLIKLKAL